METTDQCYCLELFRRSDPNAQMECLKMQCGRYKWEKRREAGSSGKPTSIKELREWRRREKAWQQ